MQLAWDASVLGYEQRPFAAEPCTATTTAIAAAAGPASSPSGLLATDTGAWPAPPAAATALEASLDALLALLTSDGANRGPHASSAARWLRELDLAGLLRRLAEFDGPPGLLLRVQRLYGAAAVASKASRDDALEGGGGGCAAALAGVLLYSAGPPGTAGVTIGGSGPGAAARLAAAGKLCAAVDGLPGREFKIVCGELPVGAGGGAGAGIGGPGAAGAMPCVLAFAHEVLSRALVAGEEEPAAYDVALLEPCSQVSI